MRRTVSRLLLVSLAVVALVAVVRLSSGSHRGAVVDLGGIAPEALAHAAFSVDAQARLALDAVGSFEERPDTALAAFGWIVRREDQSLVWRQRPGRHPARGLVSAQADTLTLAPGIYDAYFASYGDPDLRAAAAPSTETFGDRVRDALSRGGRAWVGDAERWRLVATGVSDDDRARLSSLDGDAADAVPGGAVWTSGPVPSRQTVSALLRVEAPADVSVEAVLEAAGGVAADRAALVRQGAEPDTVWTFRADASEWAGGAPRNRRARASLRLEPGLYRASVQTDGAHAWRDWAATPPWTPAAWGLTVRGPATVARVDLRALARDVRQNTSRFPVLAEMRCVGSNERREARFTLAQPTEALLVAQGELAQDEAVDFATLLRDGRPVWTMRYGRTEAAGGRDTNRRSAAHISLAPGDYTLRFQTDYSHDCQDGYNGDDDADPPDGADFWGAVLVSLDADFDPATVITSHTETPPPAPAVMPPSDTTPRVVRGEALVDFAQVRDRARLVASFTLSDKARVRVSAAGELLPGERLDYAWIEDDRGQVVWDMTRENTQPAGGAAKNRLADETLTLGPGRYVAHYVTNGRHAYGSFEGAPNDPDAWGLRVERIVADSGETQL